MQHLGWATYFPKMPSAVGFEAFLKTKEEGDKKLNSGLGKGNWRDIRSQGEHIGARQQRVRLWPEMARKLVSDTGIAEPHSPEAGDGAAQEPEGGTARRIHLVPEITQQEKSMRSKPSGWFRRCWR